MRWKNRRGRAGRRARPKEATVTGGASAPAPRRPGAPAGRTRRTPAWRRPAGSPEPGRQRPKGPGEPSVLGEGRRGPVRRLEWKFRGVGLSRMAARIDRSGPPGRGAWIGGAMALRHGKARHGRTVTGFRWCGAWGVVLGVVAAIVGGAEARDGPVTVVARAPYSDIVAVERHAAVVSLGNFQGAACCEVPRYGSNFTRVVESVNFKSDVGHDRSSVVAFDAG